MSLRMKATDQLQCDIDDVKNPKQACSRCKEVQEAGKVRLYKEPCVRQDLMDVVTFRMGTYIAVRWFGMTNADRKLEIWTAPRKA